MCASAAAIWVAGVRKRTAIPSVTVQPTKTNHGQEMCGHHSGMNQPKFQDAAMNLPCKSATKSNAGMETLHSTSTDLWRRILWPELWGADAGKGRQEKTKKKTKSKRPGVRSGPGMGETIRPVKVRENCDLGCEGADNIVCPIAKQRCTRESPHRCL